jgi:aspartate carbamoyltransferase regulatory subunit
MTVQSREKTLSVSAIKQGTVIDHIGVGNALKIISLLKLADNETRVTVGLNLKSKSMELKDLIKVENLILTPTHAAQIAIFAPRATINIIENYKVAKKFQVQMPEAIQSVLLCPNDHCITHSEPVQTLFTVEENNGNVFLRCRFCEKLFSQNIVHEKKL